MTRLLRALRLSAERHDVSATFDLLRETPWASATYVGTIHRIAVSADDPAALDAWLGALPELDLPMPGQIVADVVVERSGDTAIIEVQTIVE